MVTNRIDQSFEAILSHGLGPRDEGNSEWLNRLPSTSNSAGSEEVNPYRTDIYLKKRIQLIQRRKKHVIAFEDLH